MKTVTTLVFAHLCFSVFSQTNQLSIDQAIDLALKNNLSIVAATTDIERHRQLKKASFELPKTEVSLLYGQYNSYAEQDNNITITQAIPFTALGSQRSLNQALISSYELRKASAENELVYQVKKVYYQLAFSVARNELLLQEDSIFAGFLKAASLRYQAGETNLLEKATAETQQNQVKNELEKNKSDIAILRTQLKTLVNASTPPEVADTELLQIDFSDTADTLGISLNPALAVVRQEVEIAKGLKKVEVAKFAPDMRVGFFSQTLIDVEDPENGRPATGGDRFTGFQVGLALPLWFAPHQAKIRAAELAKRSAQNIYDDQNQALHSVVEQAFGSYQKNKKSLSYYQTSALPNADLILKQSQISYKEGDIAYHEYLLGVRNAMTIKEEYLRTLNEYNQSIIYIQFLSGNK
ncbi:MAG: TolC family protein [Chryseolinea sp.]